MRVFVVLDLSHNEIIGYYIILFELLNNGVLFLFRFGNTKCALLP